MSIDKIKLGALAFLVLGAVATGAGYIGEAQARQTGKADPRPIAAQPSGVKPTPNPERMFVLGRVLDPQGKPVAGASVMVYARSAVIRVNSPVERLYPKELGRASSGAAGRFQADIPRTSSSRDDAFGAVAVAQGYGAGWVEPDPDDDEPTGDITLRPEQILHGRLFDLHGQPARDVKLSVSAIRRVVHNGANGMEEDFEGPAFIWAHPDDMPGWPSPAVTGVDGRFALRGVGPGLRVFLSVIDPRFTNQLIEINSDVAASKIPLTLALQPARTITGRVTYADTGKPVPHAQVTVTGFDQFHPGVGPRPIITAADADGRFRANTGLGTEGSVAAFPPGGQPYLASRMPVEWSKGAVTHSADLSLPRGVMLRGHVALAGSGQPVAGAVVAYLPSRTANDTFLFRSSRPVETAADGSFALPVLPRPGYLVVRGIADDYVLQEVDRDLLLNVQPGGHRAYVHGFVVCNPGPSGESPDVTITLRPGFTVKGRVVGPDGPQVADAWLFSRIHLNNNLPLFRSWSGNQHGTTRNGRFELHGLDPDSEVPVSFLDPKRKLGATVRFSGKSAGGEPIIVKLEAWATATARLVGPDGKPVSGFTPRAMISMVVTPGESFAVRARKKGTLVADEDFLTEIDPINYQKDPASDAQGLIVFPALIPGATYRLVDRSTTRTPNGPQLRKEFTVKPGETLDLGDIVIEKPKAR